MTRLVKDIRSLGLECRDRRPILCRDVLVPIGSQVAGHWHLDSKIDRRRPASGTLRMIVSFAFRTEDEVLYSHVAPSC